MWHSNRGELYEASKGCAAGWFSGHYCSGKLQPRGEQFRHMLGCKPTWDDRQLPCSTSLSNFPVQRPCQSSQAMLRFLCVVRLSVLWKFVQELEGLSQLVCRSPRELARATSTLQESCHTGGPPEGTITAARSLFDCRCSRCQNRGQVLLLC